MTLLELTYESGLISTSSTIDKLEETTFEKLLKILDITDSDLVCWIRAPPDEEWIKVINDRLLQCLLSSYYTDVDKVSIVFRQKTQSSPNTTPHLGPVKLDSEINPTASRDLLSLLTSVVNEIEPFTQIPLKDSDLSDIMIIENFAVNWTCFPGYVLSKLNDGISLFGIPLTVETKDGQMSTVELARSTWTRYILRGHKGVERMLELFSSVCENAMRYENELQKLQSTDLFSKIKIFLNDLLIMSSNEDAETRLNTDLPAKFYFSKVYFDENEIKDILDFPTSPGLSVYKLFELSLSQKSEICTSHDLAPLIQQVFGIRKGFHKEKGFIKELKTFEKVWKKNYMKRAEK